MKKKVLGLGVATVMLLGFFGIAGCIPDADEDLRLKAGFEKIVGGDPIPGVFCAYEFSESEINVGNNTEFNLYYGLVGNYADAEDGYVSAKITASNGINTVLLKDVEGFTIDKYECTMTSDDWLIGFTVEFAHSEVIPMPMELFVGESGCITFTLQTHIYLFESEIKQRGDAGIILLYYKIANGKIILSANDTNI